MFGIQEEVISKLLFPTLLTTSSIETEGVLFLDGMAENFKWLFLYYGWKFFLPFKPLIVELVKDTKDEAM